MRHALLFTSVCVLPLLWNAASFGATIAYWQFEPGNLTFDSSGNGHTLTNTGVTSSALKATDAPGGGSASFDGSQTAFSTVSTLDLSAQPDLTIEWFTRTTQTALAGLWEHSASGGGAGAMGSFINDLNRLEGFQRGTTGTYLKSTTVLANDDTWRHFAVTIDGGDSTSSRLQLFVDGVNLGIDASVATGTPAFLNDTFYIGSRGNTSFKYVGLLDELRISNEILDPSKFLNVPVVPEPSTLGLLGLGAIGLAVKARRRRTVGRTTPSCSPSGRGSDCLNSPGLRRPTL